MRRMDLYKESDLMKLQSKAEEYCGSGTSPCNWLYRNQTESYFEDVLNNNDGAMKMAKKDRGGDKRSPINGKLSGVFFMARNEDGKPPTDISPFGPIRFQVPAKNLLYRTPKLYFADFYCMRSDRHQVILVATAAGSVADDFCRLRLPLLDSRDNPFLYRQATGSWRVNCRDKLYVEVFVTQDIQVFKRPQVALVPAGGTRSIFDEHQMAFPGGKVVRCDDRTIKRLNCRDSPKNENCQICNLDPGNRMRIQLLIKEMTSKQ